MNALAQTKYISEEEYWALDEAAERKHEYFAGAMWQMSGGSPGHAQLIANVQTTINVHLRGRACYGTSSEQRVKTGAHGLQTYPDAAIICPPPIFDPHNRNTLLNPRAIFEVLSPSTRNWDRSGKFDHYKSIASLTDYILVDQDWIRVEHFRRLADESWALRTYVRRVDSLSLELPDGVLLLPLSEFYERFDLPEGLTSIHGHEELAHETD